MSKKQSLLTGALAGSFGIFISKLLGLFYVVPLNSLAGEANMVFYSITYTYYDLLLKICGAGIPFAIAALVAKYYGREDYNTVLLIKKLGASFLLALSFIVTVLFLFVSGPLSVSILGSEATIADIESLHNLFYILSFALILVPFLSSLRGYYQGLKLLKENAASQVIEQLVRVFGIIFLGFLFVKILNFDSIYAIYMAIFAAGLGALVAIIYVIISAKNEDKELKELAKNAKAARSYKMIMKEMLSLGIPYLVISFLGTTSSIINSNFFMDLATNVGISYEEAKLALGILQVNCNKIAAIPQVLTLGFSTGLVPYLTEAKEKRDFQTVKKYIIQILETVLIILIPLVVWIAIYAKPIYFIMYGGNNLDIGTSIFLVSVITIFTDTIAPIISSICITLKMRKSTIIILLVSTLIKLISFFPCVMFMGYNGMTISTAIASIFAIVLNLYILKKAYNVNYYRILRKVIFMIIAAIISALPIILTLVINFNYSNRFICTFILAAYGLLSLIIYIVVIFYFGLPQVLWNKTPDDFIREIKYRLHLK